MKHDQSRIRNGQIVVRLSEGETAASLAAEYDLTPSYVRLLASRAGVRLPRVAVSDSISLKRACMLKRRAAVTELHSLGLSGGQARRALGLNKSTFAYDARELGLKFPYDRSGDRHLQIAKRSKDKAAKMAALYRSGMTLRQIGEKYGISRERVRQLMAKHEGMRQDGGGHHVKAVAKRQQSVAAKDARYLRKYGCTFSQYVEVREIGRRMRARGAGIHQTPLRAFHSQKNNAKHREIAWELTFWQWWTVWQESGKWEHRGRARDAFVMSRFGDAGAYAVGNIYIGTLAENSSIQPNNPYRKDHPDHDKVLRNGVRATRGCSIDGCGKQHYGHGYCNNHYYHFVTKPARSVGERAAA